MSRSAAGASTVTASEVVFDTWAWWEVLHGTPTGRRLQSAHLAKGKVHSSAYVIAELSAKLANAGLGGELAAVAQRIASAGRIVAVDARIAAAAGPLCLALRQRDPGASLADALMLATARSMGLKLVSADAAFKGQSDVLR